MSTASEIVAVLGQLDMLLRGDPAALARREEILSTKEELVERIRAEGEPAIVASSSRYGEPTTSCPVCGIGFVVTGRRQYCSDGCRRSAWASRHRSLSAHVSVVVLTPPAGARRRHTVYECDACGTRSLGDQRCEDCGVFMRRVGLGGTCPSCEGAVAACELIAVGEGAGGHR